MKSLRERGMGRGGLGNKSVPIFFVPIFLSGGVKRTGGRDNAVKCWIARLDNHVVRRGLSLFATILVGSALSLTVQAASFDCAKAAVLAEKLICETPSVNVQDDNMAFIYKYALLFSDNVETVKSTQRAWLKQRNRCGDEACLKASYQSRINALITFLDSGNRQSSTPDELKGLWHGSGKASYSIYGSILISDNFIFWGAREPTLKQDPKHLEEYCKTAYFIENEPMGTRFEGLHGDTFIIDEKSQFKSYKIKLLGTCPQGVNYMRFTMQHRLPNYAEVIEYSPNIGVSGYVGFQKIDN